VLLLPLAVIMLGLAIKHGPTERSRLLAAIDRQPTPKYPAVAPPLHLPGEIRLARMELPAAAPHLDLPGELRLPPLHMATSTPDFALPGEIRFAEIALANNAPSIPSPPPEQSPALANLEIVAPARTPMTRVAASQCEPVQPPLPATAQEQLDPGRRLAAAAVAQAADVVVYSAKYQRIAFPGGDVSAFYGVCTDVVIRAYRSIGIDLQHLVQAARTRPGGDANIEHRRVEALRTFFDRAKVSLPASLDAEAYLPGDVVTYHRPQNRSSTSHIAIVTDVLAPSGRPMIVHNRGWGVQLEDALFVDRITGHYRFLAQGTMPQLLAAFGSGRRGLARENAIRTTARETASTLRTAAVQSQAAPR
jgi:uncharacterized protein YijF (DUF1287 family)